MLFLLLFELSIIFGFLLDLLFADPEKLPHPVVIIGKGISFLEKHLRQIFPDTPGGRRTGGAVMAALGILESILGFDQAQLALMITLYVATDSIGTACNITGDGAIALVMDRLGRPRA